MSISCKHHVDPLLAYIHNIVQMTCEACELPKGMSTGQIASNLTFLLRNNYFKGNEQLAYPGYCNIKIVTSVNDEGDFMVNLLWKNTLMVDNGIVDGSREEAIVRFAEHVEEEVTKVIRSGKVGKLTGMGMEE